MNIHIKDIKLFEKLLEATVLKVEVGSTLYGLNDNESDTDYLCIFVNSPLMHKSVEYYESVHQFQYKDVENNIDYIFTDIHTFLNNIVNGDSSINFEVLHTKELKNNKYFSFLYENSMDFYTYRTMKGYTGKVKKDIKNMYKYGKTQRGITKKVIHAFRGFRSATAIYNHDYENKMDDVDIAFVEMLKSQTDTRILEAFANSIKEQNAKLRIKVNKDLEECLISERVEDTVYQDYIRKLNYFVYIADCKIFDFESTELIDLVKDANENGISYN